MYHSITLVGNLGKDPETRYTPSGKQVTNFSLATSEKWTGADGEKHEKTIWWRVAAWGKLGEIAAQYLNKGSKVLVIGRMNADDKGGPRIFTRTDGSAGSSFEVTADTIKFLSSKPADNGEAETEVVEAEADPIPF